MISEQMHLIDSFLGESLMWAAVAEAIEQNREACRCQDERAVCWMFRSEIDQQVRS